MTPIEFLRAVWPDDGFYCIAVKLPHGGYWHTVHHTIAQAAEFAEKQKDRDVYFCIHSLKEEQVWDPRKVNRETGEKGAWAIRKQTNMREAKCFFFDLDVGQEAGKYRSIGEAADELMRFCTEALLPTPMIVRSGGGLHVYWLLEDDIQTHQWRVYAERLRALAEAHDFVVDEARTTDTASVLRVAGTFNYKTGKPRPVEVVVEGDVTETEEFILKLTRACEEAGVTAADVKATTMSDDRPEYARKAGPGNTAKIEKVYATHELVDYLRNCPMSKFMWMNGGEFPYHPWRGGLSIFSKTVDGYQNCRDWSAASDRFDETGFELAMSNLPDGMFHCDTLQSLCGEDKCDGCAFKGRVISPYTAVEKALKDMAAPRVEIPVDEETTVTIEVPEVPFPYARRNGGIVMLSTNEEESDTPIYENDLFPISYIKNEEAGLHQSSWRVVFPRGDHQDFAVSMDVLYDKSKFCGELSHKGVLPDLNKIVKLQGYMIAYVKQLQREAEAEMQHTHLGWTKDKSQFILPDKVLCKDGTVKPAHLTTNVDRTCQHVGRMGSLAKQVELLKFYAKKEYLPNQFMILASLAAPILHMTGHHGAIVNASGEAGSSKSSTLYTAASLWGEPDRFPINGTNNGATVNFRNNYVTVLSNLPVCVDEITHIPPKDAANMAMNITQPNGRGRLDTAGVARAQPASLKSTIMLTTANSSLHALLSLDNAAGTAGSMRVIELLFPKARKEDKHAADVYLAALFDNFGHIGPAFMHYVVQNQAEIKIRLMETAKQLDSLCGIAPSERFWSATAAAVIVAGEIANQLGLVFYNMILLKNWVVNTLLPQMRGVVQSQYSTPLGVLTEFLEQINNQILVTMPVSGEQSDNVLRDVNGALSARYDVKLNALWVMKKAFKDYCIRIGANHLNVLDELSRPIPGYNQPIITSTDVRKVLGQRTRYAKAQTPCFVINMSHPEVSGLLTKTPEPEPNPMFERKEVVRQEPVAPPDVENKPPRDPATRSFGPFKRE